MQKFTEWIYLLRLSLLAGFILVTGNLVTAQITDAKLSGILINEVLADPNGAENFDTDGSGTPDDNDEFLELYNESSSTVNIGGWQVWDNSQLRHMFASPTNVPAGGFVVVIAKVSTGGSLSNISGDVKVEASTGAFGINNGGDVIILYNPTDNQHIVVGFNGISAITSFSAVNSTSTLVGTLESTNDSDGLSMSRMSNGDITFVNQTPTPGKSNILAEPILLDETFNASCPGLPANWVEYNSAADLISCGGGTEYIEFNGYTAGAGESWLVTSQLNIVNANYVMNFDYVKRFSWAITRNPIFSGL